MSQERDVEKGYSNAEFASKLRRLADCVESGENFEIQVAGGTAHTSLRSRKAFSGAFVSTSTVSRGRITVDMGFMAALTLSVPPDVMPPSVPPERFDRLVKPPSSW